MRCDRKICCRLGTVASTGWLPASRSTSTDHRCATSHEHQHAHQLAQEYSLLGNYTLTTPPIARRFGGSRASPEHTDKRIGLATVLRKHSVLCFRHPAMMNRIQGRRAGRCKPLGARGPRPSRFRQQSVRPVRAAKTAEKGAKLIRLLCGCFWCIKPRMVWRARELWPHPECPQGPANCGAQLPRPGLLCAPLSRLTGTAIALLQR